LTGKAPYKSANSQFLDAGHSLPSGQYYAASRPDTALVLAGEAVDLIQDIEPAGVILNRIVTETESALAQQFG
jgi:hypothetical protein